MHAACFSPVRSTFAAAIKKNFFKTWPGLTPEIITKHLPSVIATTQGHLHQEHQNLQSTKQTSETHRKQIEKIQKQQKGKSMETVLNKEILHDSFPPSPVPNIKSNDVAYVIIDKKDICTTYTDLTGRFPMRSSRGNQYILVGYHYDGNCIYGKAIKDRKAGTLTAVWEQLHKTFAKAGCAPNTYVMDNEISTELIEALDENNTTYQLVPPYKHRRNLAERAIQTYKNHFKAGLASVNPNFPLSEWDRLLEQANITLNLLRAARTNPKLSAYTYILSLIHI